MNSDNNRTITGGASTQSGAAAAAATTPASAAAAFYRKAVPVSPPAKIQRAPAAAVVVAVSDDGGDALQLFLGDRRPQPPLRAEGGAGAGEPSVAEAPTNDNSAAAAIATRQQRHLTLFDLVAVGLGGTLGSGLFVLSGIVAQRYAGPAAAVSWALAGLAAALSGAGYAELSGRIHAAGSAYAYAYVAMGELPALLAAACLSLEYCVASSAVARSWGDKVVVYLREQVLVVDEDDEYSDNNNWLWRILLRGDQESCFNPFAFLISTGTVVLLLHGVHESKRATAFFTSLKVALVAFMIVAGFAHAQPRHWIPFNPLGVRGIFRGSVRTFFGFLGYDQVVGLAGEALEPKRNLPRAILWTLATVTVVYCLATLALTGMQPYAQISPVSGFPQAFDSAHDRWAGQLTAVGEIVTLPIVLLVTVQVQPRLLHAMAEDGLVAAWLGRTDPRTGNLWNGTLCAGFILIAFSTAVPFSYLNDTISCAVLAALNLSNTSLVLMWHEDPIHPEITDRGNRAEWIMLAFNVAAIAASVALTRFWDSLAGKAVSLLSVAGMIASAVAVQILCPRTERFGGNHRHPHSEAVKTAPHAGYFRTPFVPYWPCLGIFVNWYLIAQLDFLGIAGLLVFWVMVVVYYFVFAIHHSIGGKQAAAAATRVVSSASEDGVDGVINETTPLSQARPR